jgi:hypothetical protein
MTLEWAGEMAGHPSAFTRKQLIAITYHNTIAGSPPGEQIFILFEKIRFPLKN